MLLANDPRVRDSLVFRVLERYRTTVVVKDVDGCRALMSKTKGWTGLVLDAACSDSISERALALVDEHFPQLPVARLLRAASARGAPSSVTQCERTAADIARFAAYALVLETCGDLSIARCLLDYAATARLTPRECEILSAAVAGIERGQLLEELGITVNTYKRQVRSLLHKCGEATLDRVAIGALRQAMLNRRLLPAC